MKNGCLEEKEKKNGCPARLHRSGRKMGISFMVSPAQGSGFEGTIWSERKTRMGNTVEQEKDITFSQAFVEEWLKTAPKQVLDHLKTLTEGYERLRKQVGQHEEQIARQAKLLAEQQALTSAALQLS